MITVAESRSFGEQFAKMAHKQMFRHWVSKRDKVSDENLDSHILRSYVQGAGGMSRAKALLAEFRVANES